VEVPAGAQMLAAEISAVNQGAADSDLDLYLFRDQDGKGFDADDVVALSAGPGSTESIALALPPTGSYRFAVVGFKTQKPSTFDFTTWVGADPTPDDPASPSTTPGLVVGGDPKDVAPGEGFDLQVTWSGVTAEGTYYGLVTYHDQTPADPQAPIAVTLVRVVKPPG
jgi:pre-peptidase